MTHITRAMLMGLVFAAILAAAGSAEAQNFGRQYYGGWQRHNSGYAFRHFYFKPHANFVGFKHHFVIHHPKHPNFLYFYNPYQKKFWGRCPLTGDGKGSYSILAEKDRDGDLEKIPEAAFPPPGKLPAIPESTDGLVLDLPPDDLPNLEELPK